MSMAWLMITRFLPPRRSGWAPCGLSWTSSKKSCRSWRKDSRSIRSAPRWGGGCGGLASKSELSQSWVRGYFHLLGNSSSTATLTSRSHSLAACARKSLEGGPHAPAPQHPLCHGGPDGAGVLANPRPSAGAGAEHRAACRARRGFRERLLRKPPLRALPLLDDAGAAAPPEP